MKENLETITESQKKQMKDSTKKIKKDPQDSKVDTVTPELLLNKLIVYLNELGPRSGSEFYPTVSISQYKAPKDDNTVVFIMDLVAKYKNGKEYNIIRLTNDIPKEEVVNAEKNFYDTALRVLLFQKDEVRLQDVLTGNIDGIKDEIPS